MNKSILYPLAMMAGLSMTSVMDVKGEVNDPDFFFTFQRPGDPDSLGLLNGDTDKGEIKMPARPITCIISRTEGVCIAGLDKADIICYRVYDLNKECLGTFTHEAAFVEFVYSYPESMEVRVYTEEEELFGYLLK